MRVILLGTRGFPNVQGGVESHCEGLAVHLAKLDCEVIVFARKPYINPEVKEYKNVKLRALVTVKQKPLEAFLHTLIGVFVALKYKPDILHIQAIGPGLFIPLAKLLGMKIIMTTHGSNYEHLKWGKFAKLVLRFGEFLGVVFANEVIAISPVIADEIRRKYKREVKVIPNGVVLPDKKPSSEMLEKYNLSESKYILSVGRFVPEKGLHNLAEAFNKSRLNGWKLVIVGGSDHPDTYSKDLEKKARKNENIVLTGILQKEPLQQLYNYAGLFVLPSYYEGLPIVLLEAMSYRLRCLASDIPGNRSVELPEESYFPPGNIDALSEKIKLFLDKPLSDEQKEKQLKILREKYDWNNIAMKTLEVYQKVLQG